MKTEIVMEIVAQQVVIFGYFNYLFTKVNIG